MNGVTWAFWSGLKNAKLPSKVAKGPQKEAKGLFPNLPPWLSGAISVKLWGKILQGNQGQGGPY